MSQLFGRTLETIGEPQRYVGGQITVCRYGWWFERDLGVGDAKVLECPPQRVREEPCLRSQGASPSPAFLPGFFPESLPFFLVESPFSFDSLFCDSDVSFSLPAPA